MKLELLKTIGIITIIIGLFLIFMIDHEFSYYIFFGGFASIVISQGVVDFKIEITPIDKEKY